MTTFEFMMAITANGGMSTKSHITIRTGMEGRLFLFQSKKHIATIVPGVLVCVDNEVAIIGVADEGYNFEERMSWDEAARFVSRAMKEGLDQYRD